MSGEPYGTVPSSLADRIHQRREELTAVELPVEGRLSTLRGLTLEAEGCQVEIGSRCLIETTSGKEVEAQVVGFNRSRTLLMPTGSVAGLRSQARVKPVPGQASAPCGDELLGRVIDARGRPIDGLGPLKTTHSTPLMGHPINPLDRAGIHEAFDVGVRSINGLLTLGRGQRVGLFAGSGVGKSALLGMITRHSEADVTVIGLIGERGREVNDFVRETLGRKGMERAIVVAVPADQPPLLRLHGAMLATAIAESFRDRGQQVLLLVDSLTRFAQAQREIGLATGEPPTSKGYPPSAFAMLPQLVERAGNMAHGGSITAIYTVLAEGDDQNDPIVDAARAVLDGHIVLTRALSDAAHYPAIDIGASVSRTRSAVNTPEQEQLIRRCLQLSASYRSQEDMIRVGLYQSGSDPLLDKAVAFWPRLQAFLQQPATSGVGISAARAQLADILQSQ
ncbi:FliI/YscN family ATPase [Granulosicoccus antarcticus]|uniref:Flagellum-specific ATP synthase n=1 Tax=Granulosicoccus antarcticus IMCC3135 TaxID=1192854 RepID=A0A2Z2NKE0_9GAMM|nr:FliI/YscN family ATPase [Granulosicoccus antarcticus]ASJ71776.1 Flagellum-specific ATP synthase [Granulosicoccus antarcticus IMCC3135]